MHYESNLMKRAFKTLEDSWWNSRKGWKLNIRAEYHNRYRIWKGIFKSWKLFVVYSKQKTVKKTIALKFDEMNAMKKAFMAWRFYRQSKDTAKERRKKAVEFREHNITRFTFKSWQSQLLICQKGRALEAQALGFWAYNLTSRVFKTWMVTKEARDFENEKLRLAEMHHSGVIAAKCLQAFQSHMLTCRRKRKIKDFAASYYYRVLKQRTIKLWHLQLHRLLEINELETRIIFMARKFTLRTFFIQWKYRILSHYDICISNVVTLCIIEVASFNALRTAARERRWKIEREEKAKQFRKLKMLSRHWSQWLFRCENSEELKLYPLTKVARNCFRKNRLKESLVQWWCYVSWRRKRKLAYTKADEHYRAIALPKYFLRLHQNKEYSQAKNDRKVIADDFNRELRYARSFYTWLKKSRLLQDLRMLERLAILQNEDALKRRIFTKWRAATKRVLISKSKEATADIFRERSLKTKYFGFLKKNLEDGRLRQVTRLRRHETIAVLHNNKKILTLVFLSWKKFTNHQQIKCRKMVLAETHHKKIILSKSMEILKGFLKERRIINETVQQRFEVRQKILLRWVFQRWHENVCEAIEEECRMEIADSHWKTSVSIRTFHCWRQYAVFENHKRRIEQSRLIKFTKILDAGKLRRAFTSIKTFAAVSKRERRLHDIAVEFHNRQLKLKYLSEWKCFVALSFKKMLEESRHENNRTNVALWWWSQTLQRKILFAWMDYVVISKHDKGRIAKALELRRNWMLEKCIRKWFEYSSDMMAFRIKLSQARQIKGNIQLQERLRKYALKWYSTSKERSCKRIKNTRHTEDSVRTNGDVTTATRGLQISELGFTVDLPNLIERDIDLMTIPVGSAVDRPMPRKPDYLRDSYDLNLLLGSTMTTGDIHVDNTTQQQQQDQSMPDDSLPRINTAPQPQLQTRMQMHPLNRSKRNGSIDFPVSSEDDANKENDELVALRDDISRPRGAMMKRGPSKPVLLMPPSSFQIHALDRGLKFQDSPCTKQYASRAKYRTHEAKDENEDKEEDEDNSEEDEEDEDEDKEEDEDNSEEDDEVEDSDDDQLVSSDEDIGLFNKMSTIKETLKLHQEKQNRLKSLQSRYLHLCKWIQDEEKRRDKDELMRDDEHQQTLLLSNEIKDEMQEIAVELNRQKPAVTEMARNIKDLTCKLNKVKHR
eukprot:gene5687-6388_t